MRSMFAFSAIRKDLDAVMLHDPAARNKFEAALCYSGFHALVMYRFFHFLYVHRYFLLARILSGLTRFFTGIEIHPGAVIGKGVFIDHGAGVVIGETAVVGDNVVLYQGVTLGGTGKDKGKRHPTVEDNVMVCSGAKVLGPFTVSTGAKIGAGSIVLDEVPPHATVVGVPARIVRIAGHRLDSGDDRTAAIICTDDILNSSLDELNQSLPDPVNSDIARLTAQIEKLEKRMNDLERGNQTQADASRSDTEK